MTEIAGIPQSEALAEAKPESISEYLSRDPLEMTSRDRKEIVRILREQRTRWELVEAAGGKPRASKAGAKSLVATKSAEDMGL